MKNTKHKRSNLQYTVSRVVATIGTTEAEFEASHRYSTPLSLSSTVIDTSADTTLLFVVVVDAICKRECDIKVKEGLIKNALCCRNGGYIFI